MSTLQLIYRSDQGAEWNVSFTAQDPLPGELTAEKARLFESFPFSAGSIADGRRAETWIKANRFNLDASLRNLIGAYLWRCRHPEEASV